MSFFKTRSDYFKYLSSANIIVAHGIDVGGVVRKSFHRINDDEELAAACVNFAHFPCVAHIGYNGRYSERPNELKKRRLTNGLLFLDKVPNPNSMDDRENAYDRAFEVMEQFIAAMLYDFESKGQCSNFQNLDLSLFNFDMYGPLNATLYGWLLTFVDEQMGISLLQYDPSKWNY
ncbi:MAG: hypothetical protein ABI675_19495 [Chitinophagaceae bacterium]